jgi:prevent-host-death family protein
MRTKNVTISEGKKDFTQLIKESIAMREEIIITRRGHPVAAILPYQEYTGLKRLRTYLRMLEISREMQKAGIRAKDIHALSRKELEKRGL